MLLDTTADIAAVRAGQPNLSQASVGGLQDLRRLYAFMLVAEELHFRRAAKRLMMAQSPLSRVIQSLEQDLGFRLFIRSRRSVKLTDAGTLFFASTKDLLTQAGKAIALARSVDSNATRPPDA